MSGDRAPGLQFSLLDRVLPPWTRLRLLAIAPGSRCAYDGAEWRGELVIVESGTVELEALDGTGWGFGEGAVLALFGLPALSIRNPGREIAVLSALSKRALAPQRFSVEAMAHAQHPKGERLAKDNLK